MNRAVRIVAAVVTVAAIMGADGGCVRSDRPARERHADPKRARQVVLKVKEATGPYTVRVRAGEVGSKHMGDWSRDKAVGPGYRQTLDYTSGLQIEVHMHVKGRADDRFVCRIDDGPEDKAEHFDLREGYGEVLCILATVR